MQDFIGILSLDTRFPRILGDAGNPDSYHLPARVKVVSGADATLIVRDGKPAPALVEAFIEAALELQAEGACLITSTCGFLISVQSEIAARLHIPVLLSGLCLLPMVKIMTGRPVGILTASSTALQIGALKAAGVTPEDVRIAGLEASAVFTNTFVSRKDQQNERFDPKEMEAEVVQAAQKLYAKYPEIGTIVLECGNLPPYAAAIRQALGLPVFSLLDGARLPTRGAVTELCRR